MSPGWGQSSWQSRMFDRFAAWWMVSCGVILSLGSILIGAPAGAVDLKLVTFLQDDLAEYISVVALSVPAEPGMGKSDFAGPVDFYEYDDCYAQLGVSRNSAPVEVDLVLDYAALRANPDAGGIIVKGGITVWLDEREYQAVQMTFLISDPDDRGAALYLLNRLAGLCRSDR